MILTGPRIIGEARRGTIELDPFQLELVNPNSYNYRLGEDIKLCVGHDQGTPLFESIRIPDGGIVLEPGSFLLGHTVERIGSTRYAMSLIGRSSVGRLGLFVQLSANLGHTGSGHQWTLELHNARRVRIYPEMVIGQVSFWENSGDLVSPKERYSQFNGPTESLEGARRRA
jgi:dCTP deaminase